MGSSDARKPTFVPGAYYTSFDNRILINGALLNPPYFHDNQSIPERYGALGWLIAHELLHAIDISGILIDENGNQRPHSISHQGFLTILKRTECLRKQYKNYESTSERSSAVKAQGEILSDNGGMRAAFKTYQRLLKNPANQTNESSESPFASERSFFLNFAQTFCEKYTLQGLFKHMSDTEHVIGQYRVIGVLSNSKMFSKAYNCPKDSPMNPSEKCYVW
ncbi:unnamed protein product [Trichobilharzia szidati]|nr:unnamed protein product [Trichobilharzia szidati]